MQQTAPTSLEPTASNASPAAPVNAGEDMLKILADVEGQLTRLREVQKTQDDAIVSLADRARMLKSAEDEIERSRREISQARQALEQDRQQLQTQRSALESEARTSKEQLSAKLAEIETLRASIDQQRGEISAEGEKLRKRQAQLEESHRNWEQQRTLHESELNKRHAELEQRGVEISRRQSELDKDRERIASLQTQCQTQQKELEARSAQMQTEHTELLHRVEQAEKNVGELIEKIEAARKELAFKSEQYKHAAQEASQFRSRAGELETKLHQATERADQLERDSVELARLADRERQSVEAKLTETSAKLHEAAKDRDHAAASLEKERERAAGFEKTIKALQAQLVERSDQLAESQKKLEHAGKKLSEFAAILSEQAPQLEKGAAAVAMVQEQQDQIDRLTKQLAELKLRSDPEEMQRRDERIAQLTEALRQARGQAAGQQGIAEVEHANAELTAEVDRLKLELENAQVVAQDFKRQLEERVDAETSGAGDAAALAENAAKIAALTAEIEQLHANAASDLKAQLEAQSKRHKKEVAEARQSGTAEIKSLRARVAELERELEQAGSNGGENDRDDQQKFAQKLREKAERITTVAEHLRRRRARLAKLRLLLSQRVAHTENSPNARMRTEDVLKIEQERLELSEKRQTLEVTERMMIRKWAGHKAVVMMTCLAILTVLCAGASWLAADHFNPAVISASVTLEARNRQRVPLSSEQAESWRNWHTQIFSDRSFIDSIAKRMAERRIDGYSNPVKLSERLTHDLVIDAQQDGVLTLTLAGTDPDETRTLLDVIASTLAMESNHEASNRSDNTPAVLTSERTEDGRICYSAVNPTPVSDSRLAVAAPIFGVMLAACLGLIIFIYVRLLRTRRIFESDEAPLALT